VDVILLDMSECDSVFSVISGCLKASEQADVRVSAMDCLCSALRFLKTVFLDCSQCNGLMGLVLECWCVMDNLKLRNSSSETLGEVVHNFYFALKRFGEGYLQSDHWCDWESCRCGEESEPGRDLDEWDYVCD